MNRIITAEEFADYRNISKKLNTDKINEAIGQAQQSDLLGIMGDFYFDVMNNLTNDDYQNLLNGCDFTYTDCNQEEVSVSHEGIKAQEEVSVSHEGIKALLADYVYARYITMININLTPFGAVSKSMNDSEKVDRTVLRDLSKQAQIDASYKWKYIEMYIKENEDLFPAYNRKTKRAKKFNSLNFDVI